MYQEFIPLGDDSYLEVTTRLYDSGKRVVLALRGTRDSSTPALVSVIIDEAHLDRLKDSLSEAQNEIKKL